MADVNFDAKTNWVQDETVYPADANRWEKGIKDCANAINESNAEIPKKVNKAGDTMSGTLKMSGQNEIRFGTDDNYYYIKKFVDGFLHILCAGKGLVLSPTDNYKPYYADGTNGYRLLTTEDFRSSDIGENLAPDYSAAVTIKNNAVYTAPANGWIMGYSGGNDWSSTSLTVNNVAYLNTGRKSYNTATSICFFVGKGQTVKPRADAALRFVPCIGA